MTDIVDYPAWSRGWDDGPSWDAPTEEFPVIVPDEPKPVDGVQGGVRLVLWISLVLIAIAVLGYVVSH